MSDHPIADKLAFLIYDSRSGSTLLSSLLHGHPEMAVSLETEFLFKAYEQAESSDSVASGKTLRTLVENDAKLHDWTPDMRERVLAILDAHPEMNAEDLLEAVLEQTLAAEHPDARWLVLKQGLLSSHLDKLRKRWPAAPIIHIFRDGRAVFNSKRKARNIDTGKPMQTDPQAAAHRWRRVLSAVDALADGSDNGLVVNMAYEDLVRQPEATLRSVFEQLGVSPDLPAMNGADYSERIPDKQKAIHTLVGSPPDVSRIDSWKQSLSPDDIAAYEQAAGDMLRHKGYPLLAPRKKGLLARILKR